MIVLAERVAIVETKIGALKDDTQVIRATHHEINNRMQEFVAAERLCASNLGTLVATQATVTAQIAELTEAVQSLAITKAQVEGAWKATVRFATLIAALISAIAVLAGGLIWAIQHFAVRVVP